MERNKKIQYLALIGVILIALGPILGVAAALIIVDGGQKSINMKSNSNIRDVYTNPFTLGTDQAVHILIDNEYQNVTVTLKIINKAVYDHAYVKNATPSGLSGLLFRTYTRTIGSSPGYSSTMSSLSIVWNSSITNYEIEFKGNDWQSLPGDYYVVVYGSNYWGPPVLFDISITVDGPGRILQEVFIIAGIIILACTALIVLNLYLKKELIR